jgi:hypothetical protein
MCPKPPFPVFAFASGLTGFGISLAVSSPSPLSPILRLFNRESVDWTSQRFPRKSQEEHAHQTGYFSRVLRCACLSSQLRNFELLIGWVDGTGLGAFIAPFVSTIFSTHSRWTFHYLTSAGMQITNIAVLVLVFKFRRQEGQ